MSQDFPAPAPGEPAKIMDAAAISRAIRRIADEIIERNAPTGLEKLAIVGIHTRGVEVARRLTELIEQIEGTRPAFGAIDVSMHRDDLGRRPRLTSILPTELPFDLDDRTVVLADDVFSTGRTARAALDALSEFGRPERIQLAALVDRGQRELPIRPDYVGKDFVTEETDRVRVRFEQMDREPDAVWLVKRS